MSLIDVLKKD